MPNTITSDSATDYDTLHSTSNNYGQQDGGIRTPLGVTFRALQTTSAWTLVQFTEDIAQTALDAVRYKKNYDKSVTTRICLFYVNTVRQRVDSDLTYYLLSVDGCEVPIKDASTGRCDLYDNYCKMKPYTYELKLQQKSVDGSVFMVVSVFKEMTQKAPGVILGESSNLDFTSYDDDKDNLTPNTTSTSTDYLLQLDSHFGSALSTSRDVLPKHFHSLFDNHSSEAILITIGIGCLFGVALAMVLVRLRYRDARAIESRQLIRCHINTKSYSQLELGKSQDDL